jgi:hypothetical protein
LRGSYIEDDFAAGLKYIPYIHAVTNCVHPKYGFFTAFPFDGGYYEQPYLTMQIWGIIKNCFIELIEEHNKR